MNWMDQCNVMRIHQEIYYNKMHILCISCKVCIMYAQAQSSNHFFVWLFAFNCLIEKILLELAELSRIERTHASYAHAILLCCRTNAFRCSHSGHVRYYSAAERRAVC